MTTSLEGNGRRSRTLRIALVLDKYTPSRGGEGYFSTLAEGLARRGHEIHIFGTRVERDRSASYQVHRVGVVAFPRFLRTLSYLVTSRRTVNAHHFDIVHGVGRIFHMNVCNPHGGVEKAYLRQEFASMTNRGYRLLRRVRRYLSPQHYLAIWIQKRQFRATWVRRIIAISPMVKDDIIRYYGVPEERIAVVMNGVDLTRFHPRNRLMYRDGVRRDLGVDERTILLLFAGHNYRLKGVAFLLEALQRLKEQRRGEPLHLLVAGRGSIARYRRHARRLGVEDDVTFLGPVSGLERYYAAADIYVHPTFYDSCGLTILEAMASGLPVVTSRFAGASSTLRSDEGGKIVKDPSDVRELVQAIDWFCPEHRRHSAGLLVRGWAEDYTCEHNVDATLQVYFEVLKESEDAEDAKGKK